MVNLYIGLPLTETTTFTFCLWWSERQLALTLTFNICTVSPVNYDLSKGKRFLYGRGIYSTPNQEIAEKYAEIYEYRGKRYKVFLQNRVNMSDTKQVEEENYYVTKNDKNVRPYGILFKEI